ncbi:hypothetical protein MLD38_021927 [Melastoma candidum]|uniref:Uncharacterized protein n=1 Tax=Melastoma candidum TaxID=119954 RepID=A0ACB9QHJ0_9MYRT|nr:hypothetical protein MLD38_021927 [Melastoma candidum]
MFLLLFFPFLTSSVISPLSLCLCVCLCPLAGRETCSPRGDLREMERSEQSHHSDGAGYAPASTQIGGVPPYQLLPATAAGSGTPSTPIRSPTRPASAPPLPHQQAHHFHPHQHEQLQLFWANQMQEIQHTTDFRNHTLPLARIKKIMKADEDVRMISAEAPLVFAKACEIFVLELTLRAWIHTEENKRRTLQKNDIAAAISRTDVFDFLVDIIPRDELQEEGLGVTKASVPLMGSPGDMPFYAIPAQQAAGAGSSMMMCAPVDQAQMYVSQQQQGQPPLRFMPWPHPQMPHHQGEEQGDS